MWDMNSNSNVAAATIVISIFTVNKKRITSVCRNVTFIVIVCQHYQLLLGIIIQQILLQLLLAIISYPLSLPLLLFTLLLLLLLLLAISCWLSAVVIIIVTIIVINHYLLPTDLWAKSRRHFLHRHCKEESSTPGRFSWYLQIYT